MPGIGKTTAEQIIATLKSKVTKFALAGPAPSVASANGLPQREVNGALFEDAYQALLAVGLSPVDARNRLDQVVASGAPIEKIEDILTLAFRQKT